jgi:hypothetical protein
MPTYTVRIIVPMAATGPWVWLLGALGFIVILWAVSLFVG